MSDCSDGGGRGLNVMKNIENDTKPGPGCSRFRECDKSPFKMSSPKHVFSKIPHFLQNEQISSKFSHIYDCLYINNDFGEGEASHGVFKCLVTRMRCHNACQGRN